MSYNDFLPIKGECPICGRDDGRDCKTKEDDNRIWCKKGNSFSPPDVEPGEVVEGRDGVSYACVSVGSEYSTFKPDGTGGPVRRKQLDVQAEEPELFDPFTLRVRPEHEWAPSRDQLFVDLGNGTTAYVFDAEHREERFIGRDGRKVCPSKILRDGVWTDGSKPEQRASWPMYAEHLFVENAPLLIVEGPKSALAGIDIGLENVTAFVGTAANDIEYMAGKLSGLVRSIPGVVYLADNDQKGKEKAGKIRKACAQAGMPVAVILAGDLGANDFPPGGSLDDLESFSAADVAEMIEGATRWAPHGKKVTTAASIEEQVNQIDEAVAEIVDNDFSFDAKAATRSAVMRKNLSAKHKLRPSEIARLVTREAARQIGVVLSDETSTVALNDDGWGDGEDVDLLHILPGVLQQNGTCVIAANAGEGKTEFVVDMSVALLKGESFLPFDEYPTKLNGKVLFIATDQDTNARAQLIDAYARSGVDLAWLKQNVTLVCAAPDGSTGSWTASIKNLKALKEKVDTGEYGLVIIDSFRSVVLGSEWDSTNNDQMLQFLRLLKAVVTPHAGLIIIQHLNGMNTGSSFKTVDDLASARILGQNVDSVCAIVRTEDKETGEKISWFQGMKVRGGFQGVLCPFARDLEACRMKRLPDTTHPALGTKDKILLAVSRGHGEPVKTSVIAKAVHLQPNYIANKLSAAKTSKQLINRSGGWVLTKHGERRVEQLLGVRHRPEDDLF